MADTLLQPSDAPSDASTLRSKKTLYMRPSRSLERPSWMGKGSRIGSLRNAILGIDNDYRRDPYSVGRFSPVASVLRASTGTQYVLAAKEKVCHFLYSLSGESDVDVRTQMCDRRDDPTNWDMIKRVCRSVVQERAVDGESNYDYDGDGEPIISLSMVSPNSPTVICRVEPHLYNVYGQEEFSDPDFIPRIALHSGCKLVVSAGDDGDYGVWHEDADGGEFGEFSITDPVVSIDAIDNVIIAVDNTGSVWRSLNDGEYFVSDSGVSDAVVVRVISYGEIYIGCESGIVRKSTDGGITFSEVTSYDSMTGDVVAIATGYDRTYFLCSNKYLAETDGDIIQRIAVIPTIVTPTDMIYADDVIYVGGLGTDNVPLILCSGDGGLSWETSLLLDVELEHNEVILPSACFDYDYPVMVRLASCGCGVVYASVVYIIAAQSGGAVVPADALISVDHETGDLSQYDAMITGGDINVTAAARMANTAYGRSVTIDEANIWWVEKDLNGVSAPSRLRTRLYFDPNSLIMASGDEFLFFAVLDPLSVYACAISLNYDGSNYRLRTYARTDAAGNSYSGYVVISDGPHYIELDWLASSAPGADDGYVRLYVDGVDSASVTGVDNDTYVTDTIRILKSGVDAGTSGIFYVDEIVFNESGVEIGPVERYEDAVITAYAKVLRSVDFGLRHTWIEEWSDSGESGIFLPYDLACCDQNYALATGIMWFGCEL